MNWGEAYLDHFERFLGGDAASRWLYRTDGPSLQVLAYDRVFVTLGLTHFRERLGSAVEVVAVVDDGLDRVPGILGKMCLYLATEGGGFSRGHAISGLENVDPEFARSFGMCGLYFTAPQGFPGEFGVVRAGRERGAVTAAMFITAHEFGGLKALGPVAFEKELEKQGIDPFSLRRGTAKFELPSGDFAEGGEGRKLDSK